MITGAVNDRYEAIVHLTVFGSGDRQQEIAAIVDTGFNGWLTLPPETIRALRLKFDRRGRALLADGSKTLFRIYEATINWDGAPRPIIVDSVPQSPLAGMALLVDCQLTIQVRPGGNVTIEVLS